MFLARVRGELVGYALGHILGSAESWWSDTWRTGDRVGELESISVLPEHRGAGIGSALLHAVDAEFARLGVDDQVIGVLPGNVDAIRLVQVEANIQPRGMSARGRVAAAPSRLDTDGPWRLLPFGTQRAAMSTSPTR